MPRCLQQGLLFVIFYMNLTFISKFVNKETLNHPNRWVVGSMERNKDLFSIYCLYISGDSVVIKVFSMNSVNLRIVYSTSQY